MGFVPPANLIQLLIRNPDGSIGLIPEAGAITVNLSTEQKAILTSIAEALGAGSGVGDSIFAEQDVPFNAVTTVASYTVPVGKKFQIKSARGWADVDGEYFVFINALQENGARTTPASLTAEMSFSPFIYATAGDVVTLKAEHFKVGGPRRFKGVIQGLLENI